MGIRLVTDKDAFMQLEPMWLQLEKTAKNTNYYLSWNWFCVYVDWFVESGQTLLVLVVTEKESPLALVPFAARRTFGRFFCDREIELLGSPFSPSFGALVKKGRENQVGEKVAEFLLGVGSSLWDSFLSWGLSPTEPFTAAFIRSLSQRSLDFKVDKYTENYQLNLAQETDGQQYYESLSKSTRKIITRGLKKLTELGELRLIMLAPDVTDFETAFSHYEQIYANSWKKKPESISFEKQLARHSLNKGQLRFFLLYSGPLKSKPENVSRASFDHFDLPISNEIPNSKWTPIAVYFYLTYKKKTYAFRAAFRDDFKQFSPGMIVQRFLIKYLIDNDSTGHLDFQNRSDNFKKKLGATYFEDRCYCSCANPRSIKKRLLLFYRKCFKN